MTAVIIDFAGRDHAHANPRGDMPARRAVRNCESSAQAELRRAHVRIAELERDLCRAMRDSLAHYDRARRAERELAGVPRASKSG